MPKNIMVSDEVYARLRALKREGESFTELIRRLMNYQRTSLLDLAGEWPFTKDETERAERLLEESWQKGWRQ